MKIKTKIINKLGTFESEVLDVTNEEYELIVESSKVFHINGPSFYFRTLNGIVVFPAEIANQSILLIEQIN